MNLHITTRAASPANLEDYARFIEAKSHISSADGFAPSFEHPDAHPLQAHLVDFAARLGRAAVFADCGLGKTLIEFIWGHNVCRHTNEPVLIVAPLGVSLEMVDEAEKFGFEIERSTDGTFRTANGLVITNYERLHHFDPKSFAGVAADESSILKNFDGARKSQITEFLKKVRYRLLCSATPSPNDYIELGTSSEALGHLDYMDMLGMFFRNDEDSLHPAFIGSKWRFKGHAEQEFWRWMCSWARAVRKPSDLGFEDGAFVLPPLHEIEHVLESAPQPGELFAVPVSSLAQERAARRESLEARCEKAASLLTQADSGVAWCHLNDEGDLLERLIPDAVQISGADSDDAKEEAFRAFRLGQINHLITKPKIAAFGLNWQRSCTMTCFADHSYEQYYQMVRRMWRYGQTRPVTAHTITTQALSGVAKNRQRKAEACDVMFTEMVRQMNDALTVRRFVPHAKTQELPAWL